MGVCSSDDNLLSAAKVALNRQLMYSNFASI